MEQAIPVFMQYGAMGILAAAFIMMLLLFYRADKRAQKYADALGEATFDRSKLIDVVVENTKAMAALTAQIGQQTTMTARTLEVIDNLEQRLPREA